MRYNLSLLVANVLFALNYSLFVSVMEDEKLSLGAVYIAQTLLFAAISIVINLILHKRQRVSARDITAISLMGIVNSLGWSYATLKGMTLTSPITAATIASVGPSLTLIFAHLMGRRELTGVRITGVIISLLGALILILALPATSAAKSDRAGELLLIVAMVIAALNTLILKPYLERYGIFRVALYYSIAAAVASPPLFWDDLSEIKFGSMGLWGEVELTALLLIGGAAPMMLLFEGTEYLSPLHTSLYRYTQPFITASVVIARGQGEPSAANYLALAAIVAGGILVSRGVDRAV